MPTATKYRLKKDAAPHWETQYAEDGTRSGERMYVGGQLVESERNLYELFPGKFDPPGVEDSELRQAISEKDERIAELEAALAAVRGSRQADFVEALGDKPAAKEVHEVPTAAIPSDDTTKQLARNDSLDLELREELGEDVSDKFESAAAGRMRVFHKGRNYTVVDDEGKELHVKPITRQEDVDALLEKELRKQEKERESAR